MKRLVELLAYLGICCVLAACGPGTGGTGTGPNMGATLAEGTYVGTLDTAIQPPQPQPCGSQCAGPLVLSVADARVELSLPCQRFVHEGNWTFDADGRAELAGRWSALVLSGGTTEVREQSVRMALVAELPVGRGMRLELTLRDADGATLLGPVWLAQQPQAAAAVSCLSFNRSK